MNSCNFTGRLTSDPELKTTSSGLSVCSFTLAVKRPRIKDTTDFINFVAWRQSAEYLSKYGHKGAMVEVSGTLTSRKFEDKSGNNRIAFEVVADSLGLIESHSSSGQANVSNTSENANSIDIEADFVEISGSDEDLPF